jgi:hypothetical protein
MFLAVFWLGICLFLEDENNVFLRNICWLSADYAAWYPIKYKSSREIVISALWLYSLPRHGVHVFSSGVSGAGLNVIFNALWGYATVSQGIELWSASDCLQPIPLQCPETLVIIGRRKLSFLPGHTSVRVLTESWGLYKCGCGVTPCSLM